MTALVGLLMVSNIRYHSFKDVDFRGKVPFMVMVVVMLGFAVVLWQPPLVLFLGFLAYAISGPVLTLVFLRRHRAERLGATGSGDEKE
jgi:CDP-diacylglycerol--serine O-phosphatidyltransferase